MLGFVRDLVLARIFGADAGTDAFFVAFKIPNFMRRLFAEGAFSLAFVPVLSEYKVQRSRQALKRFVDDVAGTLGMVLLAVTAIGVLGTPWVVMLFAQGFIDEPDRLQLAADMLCLTFPYLMLISLTATTSRCLLTKTSPGGSATVLGFPHIALVGIQSTSHEGADPERLTHLAFDHFFLQPRDGADRAVYRQETIDYCIANPKWRMSLQMHKVLGIP